MYPPVLRIVSEFVTTRLALKALFATLDAFADKDGVNVSTAWATVRLGFYKLTVQRQIPQRCLCDLIYLVITKLFYHLLKLFVCHHRRSLALDDTNILELLYDKTDRSSLYD